MKNTIIGSIVGVLLVGILSSSVDFKTSKKLVETDKYKVIHVDGRIIFQKTNADMKQGDIFVSGTLLKFLSNDSRAAVISSIKGRFVLSASEKGQTKILPAANNISSRSGALINLIDLQNHFLGDYLVLDKMKLEIGEVNYPMNETNFFYLSYLYNGEKINKKLSYENNNLIIDKDEIFKIDGQAIPYDELAMTLYYRQGNSPVKISEFKPVFPNLDELKSEITIIRDEFADKSNEVQIQEITAYLAEFYGKPQKENLAIWLKAEFGLE